jgi:hypothetical protein
MSRERDILAAELRSSTAEFLGWLTGLKPPSDQEAIPVEMRPAFEKMCNRLALAAEQYAAARIEALESALRQSDEALNQMIIWMPSGFAPQSQANAMRLAYEARKVIARAALAPEQDK